MFDRIFAARLRVDPLRQSPLATKYETLRNFYTLNHLSHPYETASWKLAGSKEAGHEVFFKGDCLGATVDMARLSSTFFYRVMSFSNLMRYTSPRLLRPSGSEDGNWTKLQRAQGMHSDWMELSWFLDGSLTGPRGFTWWTPSEFTSDMTACCHKIGIPDDWIPDRVVVLRLASGALSKTVKPVVPTILDGFDSPVFFATTSSPAATIGRAINLESIPLALGDQEVVCSPIPVTHISLRIALIDKTLHSHEAKLALLLPDLLAFYEHMDTNS